MPPIALRVDLLMAVGVGFESRTRQCSYLDHLLQYLVITSSHGESNCHFFIAPPSCLDGAATPFLSMKTTLGTRPGGTTNKLPTNLDAPEHTSPSSPTRIHGATVLRVIRTPVELTAVLSRISMLPIRTVALKTRCRWTLWQQTCWT